MKYYRHRDEIVFLNFFVNLEVLSSRTLGEVGGSSHTTKELSHDRKSSMAFFCSDIKRGQTSSIHNGNGLEYDTNPPISSSTSTSKRGSREIGGLQKNHACGMFFWDKRNFSSVYLEEGWSAAISRLIEALFWEIF